VRYAKRKYAAARTTAAARVRNVRCDCADTVAVVSVSTDPAQM